jgi:enamine deaminase RidA (YjgF/YER057c/UK114 family)
LVEPILESLDPPTVREILETRGLSIPAAQVVPVGVTLTYRRLVRWGDVVYVAGHGPTEGEGWGSPLGKVGAEVSLEEAISAAQLTALNVLGTIERELGTLDRVECWLKVTGYVNAIDGFTEHATVMNGFTDLLVDLYGHQRLAARTTIGVKDLPFGMPVEADAIFAWRDNDASEGTDKSESATAHDRDTRRPETLREETK